MKFVPLLFIFLASGCARQAVSFVSHTYDPNRVGRVALIGFEDYPGVTGSGEIAAGTFENYLLTAGYRLVERRQLNKILNEQALDLTGYIDPATMRRLGKILGVNALAFGSLTDFSDIRERTVIESVPLQHSEPIFGEIITVQKNKNGKIKTVQPVVTGYSYSVTHHLAPKVETMPARIGMSVRLVEAETGEVLWSASVASSGSDVTTAIQEGSSKLMQAVIKQLKRVNQNILLTQK